MDKLRAIDYFVAAARTGSLSRAARHFAVSVPAVARMVRALESELGTSLFDRTARGLILTSEGERYLMVCESMSTNLRQLSKASAEVRNELAERS